ncbi:hypothetical protein [Parafrankia elaeagni]|uniref:hypothetical protein n=1 Tax=Parafrankia elaeagni TaxID=222534 RepID=UPI000371625C|nr:hypothetical protein [Parafrankia elaeagni]
MNVVHAFVRPGAPAKPAPRGSARSWFLGPEETFLTLGAPAALPEPQATAAPRRPVSGRVERERPVRRHRVLRWAHSHS